MKKLLYRLLYVSDGILGFLSGVFISVATNIVTSGIPDRKLSEIGWHLWISAIMWAVAGTATIVWSLLVKPVQELYSLDSIHGKRGDSNWDAFIGDNKRKKVRCAVLALFLISLFAVIISIILLCV